MKGWGRSFLAVFLLLLSVGFLFSSCARKQAVSEKPSLLREERPAEAPRLVGPAVAAPRPAEEAVRPALPARELPGPAVREEAVRPRPREEVAVVPPAPPAPAAVSEVLLLKDIYFDFDKYNLKDDAKKSLSENFNWLRANPAVRIEIEGHADERGSDEYNLALGERRASAAKGYLKVLGIPEERMTTISYGEFRPMDPRHNEEAWAKNRRDHFSIVSR